MSVSGGTIVVRVQGQDIGLTQLLAKINSSMQSGQGTIRSYATAMNQISPQAKQAETALAKYAQSLAAVAA